jgi:DNA-binding transcriptional LysR family regulator
MNDRPMGRIQDAEMFVAVVDAGAISAAAQRLERSQPTVSRQLSALEARLGVRLLERTTRRLRTTTAGRVYYERCCALIEMAREADTVVSEMSGAMRGPLRLSAPPTYARKRIAPLTPEFFRMYPDLRLEMVLTSDRADVVGERLDLVVRLGPLRDSTLSCRLLSEERFVLCASPGYLAHLGKPADVAALAKHRCLVTETFGLRSHWVFLEGRRRRVVDVSACLVSDDLGMLHEAARSGLGLSVLPAYLVADDLESGALVRVLPRERLPGFRAHAVLPNARHTPQRVRALVDFQAARLRSSARTALADRGTSSAPVGIASSRTRRA